MATRNTFTPQQPDETPDDPYGIFGSVLPDAPAMPMDNGNGGQGFSSAAQADAFAPTETPEISTPGNEMLPAQSIQQPIVPPAANVNLTPGYTMPAPGPNASAPRPNVNPSVVYTDAAGNGYDPPALAAAWASGAFRGDPLNARVPDILAQYDLGPNGAAAGTGAAQKQTFTPTSSSPASLQQSDVAGFGPHSVLGDTVDQGITDLIHSHGMTSEETSLLARVNGIIANGGALSDDASIEQQQLEHARENESAAFTGQLNDARSELASRGLVSEPGVAQGLEGESIDQISRGLAPSYATAVRDIQTNQTQVKEQRLQSAIATATGLDEDAARNLVSTLGTGSQRQLGLASIALDSLQQNIQWQEFLAQYGLNRDQILYSIQNGQSGALATLLSLFEQMSNTSAGGHI